MPHLDIRLLGPPRIDVDGQPVTLPRAKALALLAMLAESSTPLRRDTLATMLWPEQNQTTSRANLRRVLAAVTHALGHDFLLADRETVGLNWPADIHADVDCFRRLLDDVNLSDLANPADRARAEDAIDLYQGDFLTGFSLRDAPAFDQWQYQTGDALRQRAGLALDALIAVQEAGDDTDAALAHAQRLLALDPLDERGHVHLMRLLARTGQRAQALRHYAHCVRLLDEELGVSPAPATTALAAAIRRGDYAPEPVLSDASHPDTAQSDTAQSDTAQSETAQPQTLQASEAQPDEIRGVSILSLSVITPAADDDLFTSAAPPAANVAADMSRALAATSARVEHVGPDGALVCFGLPVTHEDDPERALHLAFALQHAAAAHDLQVAIGVKTGPAYVTGANGALAGPLLNQAVALQRDAAPGEILVDRTTFRRVRGAFALTPHGDHTYRVQHPLSQARKARGIRGLHAPMVGRDAELAALQRAFAAARRGTGQAIFVQGEAGVGKSRLVAEFRAELPRTELPRTELPRTETDEGFLWLEGRCVEMGMAAGYWPFREILRAFFGWRFDEEAAAFAQRIEAQLRAMAAAGQLPQTQLDEIGAVIGHLLSLRFGHDWDTQLARADAAHLRYRTIAGLCRFILALADNGPLVLVIEDLHWADDLSIDLLIHLLGDVSTRPMLLLCVHRPVSEGRAGRLEAVAAAKCIGQTGIIRLHRLSAAHTANLVERLLEVEALDRQTRSWILDRAQGNPFFTEEIVRALIDAGLIARTDGRWTSAPDTAVATDARHAIPHNVDSVVLSRVDMLAPDLRHTLQVAAVVGRTFPLPVLARLAQDDDMPPERLHARLGELETRGFLYQERTIPDPEYSFHHVLTQEAIYRMIPPARRAELHQRIGAALEVVYADNVDDQVERLAFHYAQTDDHEKAVDYLLRAGRKARRAYLNEEAARALHAAVARLQQPAMATSTRDDVQGDLATAQYQLGRVHFALGRMDQAEHALRAAIAAGKAGGQSPRELAFAYFWLCEALFWRDSFAEVVAVAEEGLSLLPACEQSTAVAILTGTVAVAGDILGNVATFNTLVTWLAGFIRDLPFCEELSPAFHHVIDAALARKDVDEALAFCNDLEAKARTNDDLVSAAKVRYLQGRNLAMTGAHADAFPPLEDGLQMALKTDESTMQGFILNRLVSAAVTLGRFDEALDYAAQLHALGDATTPDVRYMGGEEMLGRAYLAKGEPAQAESHLRAGYHRCLAAGMGYPTNDILMWGWASLAMGDVQEARRLFLEAAERIPPDKPPPLHEAERKPPFFEALAGLERAMDDAAAFRAVCAELRARHAHGRHHPQQWHLEPAAPASPPHACAAQRLSLPLGAPWRWIDPTGDARLEDDDGLAIHAADGRDLWYVNATAPRLVRPIGGDCVIEVCGVRADPLRPAMGGVLLWHDLRNFVRLDWGSGGPGEISFMGSIDGEDAVFGRGRLMRGAMWLRLERFGRRVRALCSADGHTWSCAGTVELADVDGWEVGIFAVGNVERSLYPGPAAGGALRFTSVTLWSSS